MTASDPNVNKQVGLTGPARHAVAVTPDDDEDLDTVSRAVYVGVAGDLAVLMASEENDASPVVFQNAPVGWHPLQVRRVMETGTAASDIVVVW